MSTVKQLRVAAMFVIAMALLAGASALGEDWTTTPVPLTNTGLEPNASGEATLTDVNVVEIIFDQWGLPYLLVYRGTLTVTCQGLKPAAVYRFRCGPHRFDLPPLEHKGSKDGTELKAPKDGTVGFSSEVEFVNSFLPGEEPDGFDLTLQRKCGTEWNFVLICGIPRPAQ